VQWPKDITNDVISSSNPNGKITNLDLELAGVLLQEALLEAQLGTDLAHVQLAIGCDNSPAVAWINRMATTPPSLFACSKDLQCDSVPRARCQQHYITSPASEIHSLT